MGTQAPVRNAGVDAAVTGTSSCESRENELLLVGDVHLGRRPVGLDEVLTTLGIPAETLSPAAALGSVVDEALARAPRGVVFAGDVVDQDQDRFEAYPHLERAVARLVREGVSVYAVAGNHDSVVLPRLAERVGDFRLLGAGGRWERVEIPGEGPPIDLLGWSFPSRRFSGSPLEGTGFNDVADGTRPDATVIGVLHGDLDASGSSYAPVRRVALEETPLHACFLGHVHRPDDLDSSRPIGYLGSLVGLDAGEPGPHGPWRISVGRGVVAAEQVPLGPVRFETLTVGLDDESAVDEDAVHQAVERAALARLRDEPALADEWLQLVVARATLTGRLADRRAVRALVKRHSPNDTVFHRGAVPIVVQCVLDETRVAVDLETLASEPSPVGHVARRLISLHDGPNTGLLKRVGEVIAQVADRGWQLNEYGDHDLPETAVLVERAAWRVLDSLLEQRRDQGG